MVYALVVGAPPFETESVAATYERIAAGTFALPATLSLQVTDRVSLEPRAQFLFGSLCQNCFQF